MAKASIRQSVRRIALAVIIIALIPWLIWHAIRDIGAQRAVLSDGTAVYLERVSGGTNAFCFERSWQKWARKIFPKDCQAWIAPGLPYKTGRSLNKDALTVNLLTSYSEKGVIYDGWECVDAIDDTGFVYVNQGRQWDQLEIRLFPRRQKEFLMRLSRSKYSKSPDVEFKLPNPLWRATFAEFRPEEFPIIKSNGPVQVTLLGLALNSNPRDWRNEAEPRWKPQMQVESADGLWRNLPVTWLSNAVPNQLLAEGHEAFARLSDATGNIGDNLSAKEPAWKLNLRLFHSARVVATNETWTLTDVMVPSMLSMNALREKGTVNGQNLWIPVVCGAGTLVISNQTSFQMRAPARSSPGSSEGYSDNTISYSLNTIGFETPFAIAETAGGNDTNSVWLLQVCDPSGNVWQTETAQQLDGYNDSDRGRLIRYAFPIRARAGQRVNLKFILIRGVDFEFTIKPPRSSGEKHSP